MLYDQKAVLRAIEGGANVTLKSIIPVKFEFCRSKLLAFHNVWYIYPTSIALDENKRFNFSVCLIVWLTHSHSHSLFVSLNVRIMLCLCTHFYVQRPKVIVKTFRHSSYSVRLTEWDFSSNFSRDNIWKLKFCWNLYYIHPSLSIFFVLSASEVLIPYTIPIRRIWVFGNVFHYCN